MKQKIKWPLIKNRLRFSLGSYLRVIPTSQDLNAVPWQDFQLIWAAVLLLLLLIAFEQWLWFLTPVRLLLGLLYILYMPGYCLTAVFFPRADEVDAIERTGLSVGLSIGMVPLLALLVDRLSTGLHLWPILLAECGVMALFTIIALERRLHLPAKSVPKLSWDLRPWWHSRSPIEKQIYQTLTALLLVVGIYGAWLLLAAPPDQLTTEFYILGQERLAENYPRQATLGEELTVTMGVTNHEQNEHHYRVEIWAVDPWQTDQRELVSEIELGTLSPNDGEESLVTWSMPWIGQDQKVEFLLFIDNQTEPYRQLRLWLDVVE